LRYGKVNDGTMQFSRPRDKAAELERALIAAE
jgi:hypothetical protein